MTKFVWSGAQDSNWYNPNNWVPALVPGSGDTAIITASAANQPVIPDNSSVTISTNFSTGGVITVNSTGDNTDLIFNGTVVASGGGKIILSDSPNNRIYGGQSGSVLDNQETIQGAGQIYANYGYLSLLNDTTGVINANGMNALSINNIGVTNEHILESTNTTAGNGGLSLWNVTIDNSKNSNGGVIEALGANSHVDLNNVHIIGGALTTTGGGVIQTTGGGTYLDGTTSGAPATISTGSAVRINDGTNLTVAGAIVNNGTLTLASGQNGVNYDNTDLIVNGTTTLSGTGSVTLSDVGANGWTNRIYGGQSGSVLDNQETIQGAGQIYANYGYLSLLNDTAGVINANGKNTLSINYIGVTNEHILKSTNTTAGNGGLYLWSATIDNSQNSNGGVIKAVGANSHVDLNNDHIIGGALTTTGGGVIQTTGGGTYLDGTASGAPLTISTGSSVRINDGMNLTVSGAIVNNGTLTLASGQNGVNYDNTDLIVNGNTTLSGTGSVTLSDVGAGGWTNRIYSNQSGTVLDNQETIQGAGQIFANYGYLSVLNDTTGVINANGKNTLSINYIGVTNEHILKSTNTTAGNGGLYLWSATIDNSQNSNGGVVEALGANSHVDLNNDHIIGGALTTTGGGVIQTVGSYTSLDGTASGAPLTISSGSTVKISDGTNLYLSSASGANGTINNQGTLSLNSGQDGVHFDNTDLIVGTGNGGTVALTGGGKIILSNSGANRIYSNNSSTTLDNVNNVITGGGQIFSNYNYMNLVNEAAGYIYASSWNAQLNINNIVVTNKGLVASTNTGGLALNSMTLSQSGAGSLRALAGNVYIAGADIIGGVLASSGYYMIETSGYSSTLDGSGTLPVTIAVGSNVLVNDGQNLTLAGTIANNGTLALASGQDGVHFDNTDLLIYGTVKLTGIGTVQLSASGANRIYSNWGGSVLDNVSETIAGGGQMFSNYGYMSLVNESGGTIKSLIGDTLTIGMGMTNNGVLEANGGKLDVQGAVGVGSGTAGSGVVANGGTLEFDSSAPLAKVTFASASAGTVILPFSATPPAFTGFAYGDVIQINGGYPSNASLSLQYVPNSGGASGVLTVYQTVLGVTTALVSYTFNGVYTAQSFALSYNSSSFTISGAGDVWNGSTGAWSAAANWSKGAAPGANDDAAVNAGAPTIASSIGTIRSLTVGASGTVDFAGVTGNSIASKSLQQRRVPARRRRRPGRRRSHGRDAVQRAKRQRDRRQFDPRRGRQPEHYCAAEFRRFFGRRLGQQAGPGERRQRVRLWNNGRGHRRCFPLRQQRDQIHQRPVNDHRRGRVVAPQRRFGFRRACQHAQRQQRLDRARQCQRRALSGQWRRHRANRHAL